LATLQSRLAFNKYGLLPKGEHRLTLGQLEQSILVRGPRNQPWDARWRLQLVKNLAILLEQLWQVGIDRIFIDGSFVEDKAHPHDIDGYFECDRQRVTSGHLAAELNQLSPHRIWVWDDHHRIYDPSSGKAQLPMWHMYHVELYPHFGQSSGIKDEFGNTLVFPAAFRKTRDGHRQKGIVRVIK
jgi:hypothetical protein